MGEPRRITFDLDALRSFVAGVELGSFSLAAQRLHRSTSAVSAQLKKLEQQSGAILLQKRGRGLAVTASGEVMLAYARRLLELNDEAAGAITGQDLDGSVRIGMQEDFGETLLPAILGQFSRAHPQVRISARIGRNAELLDGIIRDDLDLALSWQGEPTTAHARQLQSVALHWIGSPRWEPGAYLGSNEPLPLLVFDAPCIMRSFATAALDRAGVPWRVAFTSRSLSGIWAAASAGLGITVRSAIGKPDTLRLLDHPALPALPALGIVLHQSHAELPAATARLGEIICRQLAAGAFTRQEIA
ncbi:LysR substrate-binding domain-containing protein [Sodalis sp. RH21]|uniref:LysR substrate-binding domain-containing protein n=1 Tax=unclassified Sodalis (in: enterobacteria) TaxID=2636512 RepID=UPI0039B59263